MKSELFAKILSIVADATELSTNKIISMCKTEECVAARALFVHFCCKYGVPTCAIKDYLGRQRTSRCLLDYGADRDGNAGQEIS